MVFFRLKYYLYIFFFSSIVYSQEESLLEGYYNDPSLETQTAFVSELLYVAGYVPEKIEVYQTLPNYAHVYRVKLDSVTGGFMFVRWDKEKKEHFIANKMIDPGLYYNLKTAREIMRKQTLNASFSVEDAALQASDQEQINESDLLELRSIYDKEEEEKKKLINGVKSKEQQKNQRKLNKKNKKRN